MELVRKQTYITPEQDRVLKRLARRAGVTEAELMRRALKAWISSQGLEEREDPFESIIGMFSGPSEVDHDDIYR